MVPLLLFYSHQLFYVDGRDDIGMEQFMKGVEEAIAKTGKIDRKLAHSLFVGPPGSGKSSFIDRLLKRLRKKFSVSTGVCDSIIIVDIDAANPTTFHPVMLDSDSWKEVGCDLSFVGQMGQESIVLPSQTKGDEAVLKPKEKAEFAQPNPSHKARKVGSVRKPQPRSKTTGSAVSVLLRGKPTLVFSESIDSVIKKHGFHTVKKYLKKTCSLYLRDTGGQVEFQEMLPLLIHGPSIFFFVFRLDLDFKNRFSVQYRMSASESLNCYTSSITTEEALLQCLASVYAMDMSDEDSVKTHKPLVFIVGTHKDKLGPKAAEKIANLNAYLDELIQKNGFQYLVQFSDKRNGHVMFTVDNTCDGDEDFKLIRSNVNHLINVCDEFSIEYPISYLLFCLDLQNLKDESILTLDECRELAARYGIEGDQVLHLLRFLHIRIGIIRHFNVEGLEHIIVKEPQVLFNKVTDLIVKTFSCKSLRTSQLDDFEKKGILTVSAFKSVLRSEDKISPSQFLQLLSHLRIITPFSTPEGSEKRYFVPCVLNHVPELTDAEVKTDILPLAFKFECNHCPKGIFGVLSTRLMSPESDEETDTTFNLIHDKIFKDQVSFEVRSPGVHDEISLRITSSHLEVKFFPDLSEDRDTLTSDVCNNVRQILEKSVVQSLKDLHYSKDKIKPLTCFRCTNCTELHPVEKGRKWHLIHCAKARKTCRIPPQGRCWYGEG